MLTSSPFLYPPNRTASWRLTLYSPPLLSSSVRFRSLLRFPLGYRDASPPFSAAGNGPHSLRLSLRRPLPSGHAILWLSSMTRLPAPPPLTLNPNLVKPRCRTAGLQTTDTSRMGDTTGSRNVACPHPYSPSCPPPLLLLPQGLSAPFRLQSHSFTLTSPITPQPIYQR